LLFGVAMLVTGHNAGATPASQGQVLPISVTVDVDTTVGPQHVVFSGWMQIETGEPRVESGVQVIDLQVTKLHLIGASQIGRLNVALQDALTSRGEVRAQQADAQFPASSFIDLYPQIDAPDSPIGALVFHNDVALHLVPWSGGREASIAAWPPMGAEYRLQLPSPTGDGPSCVPFVQQGGQPYDLGLCVADVRLDIPPALPAFSVGRNGPSRLHPADLLGVDPPSVDDPGQAPFVRLPCASLGLTATGCDDGSDGTQDSIVGLSFGRDMMGQGPPAVRFSVAPGAQGQPGTAIRQQHDCPPSQPGVAPEAESDVFSSVLDGTDELLFDGNGPIGTCPIAFPIGLIEAATARDRVDALEMHDASVVDTNGDGVPDQPAYFTLDAESPSLGALGFSAGDILTTVDGNAPALFASAAQLGLQPGDEIEAFCLQEDGDRTYGARDVIYFALTPRSPSLVAVGAGPGDVLSPGSPPQLVVRGSSLGLAATDALGALSCETALPPAGARGDANCDGVVNEIDAQLVLQYEARLSSGLPCADRADTNGDGLANSIDAMLILQLEVGLIDRLP
jgi:hypothetical protein